MKKNSILFALSTIILGSNALANIAPAIPQTDWKWVTSISMGPAWTSAGDTQTFDLTPDIEKTFKAKQANSTLGSVELFFGLQKPLFNQVLGQLGLMLSRATNADLRGNIWDDADPQFDNYTYQYKIRHNAVALKGLLLLDKGSWLPWISGSVGVGFNYSHGFTNTPTIYEGLPADNFSNNSKASFTYTLGVGIQKPLNKHCQMGIGYEFADWGQSELGRANAQTLNSGLALNHLYISSVLMNLTYLV
jgi:opacity protein-like surface antigen